MTPAAATVGQQVAFDGMGSSDPCGTIVAWDWDLDGDGIFETSGATPSHTYAIAGTVMVQLRVTDDSATTHIATQDLVVSAAPAPPPPPPVTPSTVGRPIARIPHAVARLMVAGAARQRGVHVRGVAVQATCDPGCVVTATGSIALAGGKKIALTKSSQTLAAGRPLKLVLVVPKKSRAALKAHFKKGKAATATIVLTTSTACRSRRSSSSRGSEPAGKGSRTPYYPVGLRKMMIPVGIDRW